MSDYDEDPYDDQDWFIENDGFINPDIEPEVPEPEYDPEQALAEEYIYWNRAPGTWDRRAIRANLGNWRFSQLTPFERMLFNSELGPNITHPWVWREPDEQVRERYLNRQLALQEMNSNLWNERQASRRYRSPTNSDDENRPPQ